MVITYHGGQCFKVSVGDTTIVSDPISKKSRLPSSRFGADVVFVSLHHPDYNGAEEMSFGAKTPFVIYGPGEYEVGEITVRGYGVPTRYEGVDRFVTVYRVIFEGMNLVFLGALGNDTLDPSILGALDDIDILFVPIGGGDVLDVPAASKLATKLEARCIIPMNYSDASLSAFFKEVGVDPVTPLDKFTVKKKDVAALESEVVVVSSK